MKTIKTLMMMIKKNGVRNTAKKIRNGEPMESSFTARLILSYHRVHLQRNDKNTILNQMSETRDESKKDMLNARLAQINEQDIERPITSEPEHANRKIKHAHQTHTLTKKLFNALKNFQRLHPVPRRRYVG